ncbi:hypothetical protein E2C01_088615 [Portunus trituberculatus]|uniref:Uncharacterized protein n=1 Tax=Portunus trituberculatus TaxID=210409 RepID=A0A5B7JJV6_PORTR|nr:hypothetical protein [Portunus trituberculatus]
MVRPRCDITKRRPDCEMRPISIRLFGWGGRRWQDTAEHSRDLHAVGGCLRDQGEAGFLRRRDREEEEDEDDEDEGYKEE